jgi:hypothetical protein
VRQALARVLMNRKILPPPGARTSA